jgi:diguanylate cyclase (GGDEF)-like protein
VPPRDRILLIDPDDERRPVLARRLSIHGYAVDEAADPAVGAEMALMAAPFAVIADLWGDSISGVQVCRLLGSEPATSHVPVILRGMDDAPRNRFWAERAGASAYVIKGRTSQLMDALGKLPVRPAGDDDGFFVQLSGGGADIRDRIARHLDDALFDAVLASEIRALSSSSSHEQLFARLTQFMSQVARYRWLALATSAETGVALHHHASQRALAHAEACAALGWGDLPVRLSVEDDDAVADDDSAECVAVDISFASGIVARFALGLTKESYATGVSVAAVVGRELGGAVRMTGLVEEAQRLAGVDPLTGVMNRRAFCGLLTREIARGERYGDALTVLLMDVDHFKQINDQYGHAVGDRVLSAIGALLPSQIRTSEQAARWGGEEFVVAYTSTGLAGAGCAAERLRAAIESLQVQADDGSTITVTVSIGLAERVGGEGADSLVARADAAMYASKAAGRNRVSVAPERCLSVVRPSTDPRPDHAPGLVERRVTA